MPALLRRVIEAERQLFAQRGRITYDDLALAVKTLAAKNAREREILARCVREIVSAP